MYSTFRTTSTVICVSAEDRTISISLHWSYFWRMDRIQSMDLGILFFNRRGATIETSNVAVYLIRGHLNSLLANILLQIKRIHSPFSVVPFIKAEQEDEEEDGN